jgi:hypothetical protein
MRDGLVGRVGRGSTIINIDLFPVEFYVTPV